jgi:hypothetical protein
MKNLFLSLFICAATSVPALAQRSGQNATVNIGVVQKAERVTLQSTGGGTGAAVGAVVGAATGDTRRRSRRNAVIGAGIGAAVGSSGTSEGMQYTVKVGDGSAIVVVSDQLEIQVGDCVTVEQSGDLANIRRQSQTACEPAAREVVADLQDELVEDADECAEAKRLLLDATTPEEIEAFMARARILCD